MMISKIGTKVIVFSIPHATNHAKCHANDRKWSCNPLHKHLRNHINPPKSRYNARVRAKSSRWPSVSILTRLTPPLPCIFMIPQ